MLIADARATQASTSVLASVHARQHECQPDTATLLTAGDMQRLGSKPVQGFWQTASKQINVKRRVLWHMHCPTAQMQP